MILTLPIRRILFWLLVGLVALASACYFRFREEPAGVPESVRTAGLQLVREQLNQLDRTDFGQTERGQKLIQQARQLLREDRIDFSARLNGPRGVTWRPFFWSPDRVFIKVLEQPGNLYLHQVPYQLMEALIHESLHAIKRGYFPASRQEEWDAFVAGLQAEHAMVGLNPSPPLRLDGMSVAEFVARNYPGVRNWTNYQPVAQTREWLERMAGEQGR